MPYADSSARFLLLLAIVLHGAKTQAPKDWNPHSVRAALGDKALVTGGAGFIGSHVAHQCVRMGFRVVVVDDLSGGFAHNLPQDVLFVEGDLKDPHFVANLMGEHQFTVVYHLAAYAAEGLSHFIRSYNYQNNVVASANLITQSVRSGTVKRFVFTSSIAVYGSGQIPFDEQTVPLPEDPYGIGKYAVELDLHAAASMFGLEYVILRPHNVYGPRQNMFDKYRNVVGIFLNQLQASQNLTIFGDGSQTRKFSYIDDVSFPIALSGLAPHAKNQVFNVGGRVAYSVKELAESAIEAWADGADTKVKVTHLAERNEVKHAESSHTKIDQYFPNMSTPVSLKQGMALTVAWAKTSHGRYHPIEFNAVELKKNMPRSWVHNELVEVPILQHTKQDNQPRPLEQDL